MIERKKMWEGPYSISVTLTDTYTSIHMHKCTYTRTHTHKHIASTDNEHFLHSVEDDHNAEISANVKCQRVAYETA